MKFYIPTPTISALRWGPLTIHLYALMILIGVIVAVVWGQHRYRAKGGDPEDVLDVALWSVPAGIIGGRIYHVITSPDKYFGSAGKPWDALKIYEGGLGIWGAIALGSAVAYISFSRKARSTGFAQFADALAPAILLAQAIGRWGNWFNAELFGQPTTLPWGLHIPLVYRPFGYENFSTFQPTFLYESLWSLIGVAGLVLVSSRMQFFRIHPGGTFLGYIFWYTLGRTWIESLRIDEAHHIWGVRLNVWVSVSVCTVTAVRLLWIARHSTHLNTLTDE